MRKSPWRSCISGTPDSLQDLLGHLSSSSGHLLLITHTHTKSGEALFSKSSVREGSTNNDFYFPSVTIRADLRKEWDMILPE